MEYAFLTHIGRVKEEKLRTKKSFPYCMEKLFFRGWVNISFLAFVHKNKSLCIQILLCLKL